MSAPRVVVEECTAIRRELGAELRRAAAELRGFVDQPELGGAQFVTTVLALLWVQASPRTRVATWPERLGVVRRFAP